MHVQAIDIDQTEFSQAVRDLRSSNLDFASYLRLQAPDLAFQIGAKTIACLMTSTEVRCDIRNHAWKPANPGHCDADQSPGMRVNTKGVAYTCSDRPLLGHGPVLAHNTVVRNGGFVCTMVTTQVTCLNGSGHGFTLSRLAAKKV